MEFLVSFGLRRPIGPTLLSINGKSAASDLIKAHLSFRTDEQLVAKLKFAGLPLIIAEQDFTGPMIVDTSQLRALGMVELPNEPEQ